MNNRVPLAQHLRPLLARVASVHTSTKFLSIPAGLCIPNYPDKNVPTLLIYRNGEPVGNVVAGMGLNGMKTTAQGTSPPLPRYLTCPFPSSSLSCAFYATYPLPRLRICEVKKEADLDRRRETVTPL